MPAYKGEHEDILKPFFDAMRFKLAANKHKGKRFEDLTFERMFELLQGEVIELKEALEGGNQFEIIFEAADIANFALFVATKAIREAGRTATGSGCVITGCQCKGFTHTPGDQNPVVCTTCKHSAIDHIGVHRVPA